MALSAEEMAEVERLLAPGSGISDEVRTQLLQRRDAMQDEHLSRSVPAPDAVPQLNPSFSLLPQALAVQPASTHPAGDKAAEAEFKTTGGGSAAGSVVVYDVPLAQAKKDLLEHPEKIRALYPNLPPEQFVTPEEIMAMDHDDDIMRSYQDLTWRDTAAAAAERGVTVYRYSRTPWFQGEGGNTALQQLGHKLSLSGKPVADGLTTFVMGVDNVGSLGLGRAAQETADAVSPPEEAPALTAQEERDFYMHPTLGKTPKSMQPKGSTAVGGVTETDTRERNAQLEEENPGLYFGGQALAALTGWGVAGQLFNRALGVAKEGAQMLGGGTLARLATGTAGGVAGAAVTQGAQDAVTLGANAAQGTEAPFTAADVPGRMGRTAAVAAPFAAAGAAVQGLAHRGAEEIRWGDRYDGKVGNLERDVPDMRFRTVRGPVSKSIQAHKVEARKADKDPNAMLAREVAPKISAQLDEDLKAVYPQVDKQKSEFLASNEGKQKLPVRHLTEKAVEKLRHHMEARRDGGVPDAVGLPGAGNEVKTIFNQEIDGVSLTPVQGAIPLSPEEAEAFLIPLRHKQLLSARPGKTPKVAPGAEPRKPGALEPPEELPQSPAGSRPRPVEGVPAAPENVANVPAKRVPNAAPGATQRFGAKESIKGRKPPPPEPKKPPVRVSGPGRAEATEESGSLAQTLRARGYDQVYVIPRRHDAEHHEALLKTMAGYRERNPSDKDLADLDHAARVDRDARPLNGQPGGWSALQNQHSELIERAKVAKQLGGGEDSFKVLTSYGRSPRGEDPTRVDVLRDAAERAGVREQLDKVRSLEPYEELRRQARFEQSRAQPNPPGKVKSTVDFLGVRAFPALRALEGPLGVGARGGRAANLGRDEAVKEQRRKKHERKAAQ